MRKGEIVDSEASHEIVRWRRGLRKHFLPSEPAFTTTIRAVRANGFRSLTQIQQNPVTGLLPRLRLHSHLNMDLSIRTPTWHPVLLFRK